MGRIMRINFSGLNKIIYPNDNIQQDIEEHILIKSDFFQRFFKVLLLFPIVIWLIIKYAFKYSFKIFRVFKTVWMFICGRNPFRHFLMIFIMLDIFMEFYNYDIQPLLNTHQGFKIFLMWIYYSFKHYFHFFSKYL